ncbi:RMD1 family protein, partial [Candidatus Woesearchaeota archaeon]|nr:RMD1 family protein [Candidatus Woesearchaeota archaeon]
MAHKFKAYYIAKEIPISKVKGALPFTEVSATRETAVYKLDGSFAYVYSFGSVVFVDASQSEEKSFVVELGKKVPLKGRHIQDDYELVKDPKAHRFNVSSSGVVLKTADSKVLGVVARILAQSVALESYEDEFDRIESDFSEMNRQMSVHGRLKLSSRDVIRMIAKNNIVMEEIVSGIGVLDKPDAAWDSAFLDALHTKLSDEFELQERYENINGKMDFVQENYKVFLESLRSRRDARIECIII